MLISTEIGSFEKFGTVEEILAMLKNAGFDAYDFSMHGKRRYNFIDEPDYKERAAQLRAYADGIGIKCNQSHAPFPTAKKGDGEYNEKNFPRIVRALEISGILGAKVCVVHPCNDYTAEENAEIYRKLLPFAEKSNVVIATENMWNWDREEGRVKPAACSDHIDYKRHLDALESPYFAACLDIGHAEMAGLGTSAVLMAETLDKRLIALHIHDNDRLHDSHKLPYTCNIDFDGIISALAKIGYEGDVTFEADSVAPGIPKELIPSFAAYMRAVGEYIRNEIISRRK